MFTWAPGSSPINVAPLHPRMKLIVTCFCCRCPTIVCPISFEVRILCNKKKVYLYEKLINPGLVWFCVHHLPTVMKCLADITLHISLVWLTLVKAQISENSFFIADSKQFEASTPANDKNYRHFVSTDPDHEIIRAFTQASSQHWEISIYFSKRKKGNRVELKTVNFPFQLWGKKMLHFY